MAGLGNCHLTKIMGFLCVGVQRLGYDPISGQGMRTGYKTRGP